MVTRTIPSITKAFNRVRIVIARLRMLIQKVWLIQKGRESFVIPEDIVAIQVEKKILISIRIL